DLPASVIETDEARHAGRPPVLTDAPAIIARGGALAEAWRDMQDALARWADSPLHAKGFHDAETELRVRAHAVTDAFAELGLACGATVAIATELARVADPTAALVASVERHEARHAFDAARDKPLRYPAELARFFGRTPDDDAFVRRTRAELSAYLSQLGNEPA